MIISLLQQHYKSRSSKKGVVVDIDLIVAYVLFISLILLLVNYTLKMMAPFSTGVDSIKREENTIAIKNMLKTRFNYNKLNDLCNINYTRLRRLSVSYTITGFIMPFKDTTYNGIVSFIRNGDELIIKTNSTDPKNITINIILPNVVSVKNISLESNDYLGIHYDNLNNLVVLLKSKTSNNDVDEIKIKRINGIVAFNIEGVNLSNCYIGNIPISNYCGTKGIVGTHTSFQRYGLMSNERTNYYVKLNGDVWWTD